MSPAAPPVPQVPAFQPAPIRLGVPPRSPARPVRPLLVRPPRPLAVPAHPAFAVRVPPPVRPTAAKLAARFFAQAYRKARDLFQAGLIQNAKAEYAAVIVLFPDTPYARNAARYALRLFQREFAAGQQAEMLVAYLRWVRAAAGERGMDHAEYLALQSFGGRVEPAVVAREAGAFVRRYPDSAHIVPVRLQWAIALEETGKPKLAIEALAPVAEDPAPLEADDAGKARARALLALAWLHLFGGRGDQARPLLQRVAEQEASPPDAAEARRLLEALAAQPPDPAILPRGPLGDAPFAVQLLQAADALRRQGHHEAAMDLYALFLRVGKDLDDYTVHRDRIRRFQETGRMDE